MAIVVQVAFIKTNVNYYNSDNIIVVINHRIMLDRSMLFAAFQWSVPRRC